jgi:DNA-binding MarR family transcriptional regulator
MGVQLAELTAFVALAEQLSFTKAAVQVGVALPTMSQTIRSLEERLGVRLFNRTTRSVALTEAGARLLAEYSRSSKASTTPSRVSICSATSRSGRCAWRSHGHRRPECSRR